MSNADELPSKQTRRRANDNDNDDDDDIENTDQHNDNDNDDIENTENDDAEHAEEGENEENEGQDQSGPEDKAASNVKGIGGNRGQCGMWGWVKKLPTRWYVYIIYSVTCLAHPFSQENSP